MNNLSNKNVTDLSDEELIKIHNEDPVLAEDIKSIYIQQIETLKFELDKIEKIFSDFTNRSGVLITSASLLSFLPTLVIQTSKYLPHFFIWTFPFLLLSLVFYYFSSLRNHVLLKGVPFAPAKSAQALILLRKQTSFIERAWTEAHSRYDKVLLWSRRTHATIYAYITSLVINAYLFVFIGQPSNCLSLSLLLLIVIFFVWVIFKAQSLSQKNVQIP